MAQSPRSAERRANLIRELATQSSRDRRSNRFGSSASSSSGSVAENPMADIDTASVQLPAFPGPTPSLPSRPRPEEDFKINTSALRRAFPDFSQYGSSDEDSIEIGRGLRAGAEKPFHSDELSQSMSLTVGSGRYRIMGTPPIKRSRFSGNAAERGDLRRPSEVARSVSQKENIDPKGQPVQPRVDSEDGMTSIVELPQSVNSKPRGSRFSSGPHEPLAPLSFKTSDEKRKPLDEVIQQATFNSSFGVGTQASFALPDLPNITELVSGVRADGTPLFSRSAKSRTRFGTPGNSTRKASTAKPQHLPVESVPIPPEEKALYLSLQLLQERVQTLEAEKDEATKKADENELEILQLKSKLEETMHEKNSDSGVGFDAEETKTRDWDTERSQIEMSMHSLQARLDKANEKLTQSNMTIKNLTTDRDAAHAQLANAFVSSEELKKESAAVYDEIEGAKTQLAKVHARYDRKIAKLIEQESELRQKIQRREKAINQIGAIAKELWETRKHLASTPIETTKPIVKPSRKRSMDDRSITRDFSRNISKPSVAFTAAERDATTKLDFTGPAMSAAPTEQLPKDETFLSFMEGDEVAKLQKILDEDKARLAGAQVFPRPTGATKDDESLGLNTLDLQDRLQDPADATQKSLASVRSDRRRKSTASEPAADMTSALILPDITLTGAAMAAGLRLGEQKKTTVPRPVPVSDRVLDPEQDHTVRPSHPPGVALAIVLKSLEDEVAALRVKLAHYEAQYNQHDPALSRRRRHAVFANIQTLLAAVEIRADQIYALYDVLEGQKHGGQLMHESQVDVTLRDVGIDPAAAKVGIIKQSGRPVKRAAFVEESDLSEDESEVEVGRAADVADWQEDSEELPWEGIEGTATLGSLKGILKP